ncbi:MAG TPA: TolC family protein [Candidatus Acidoferrum sp.]|nr:TolC family protein [Candidatus Acidoferrum sp.]
MPRCAAGTNYELDSTLRDREKNSTAPHLRNIGWRLAAHVSAALAIILLMGCTAAQHRRAADRETYGIVAQAEREIFGTTNAFSIDTPYSGREPKEILPQELINNRQRTGVRTLRLEDALDIAATQSRRYQAAKEVLYLTALTLTGARHEFSPQFFAGARGEYLHTYRTENGEVRSENLASLRSAVGVSQFLKTGGRLSAALANDVLRYYTGKPRQEIISLVTVNFTQPLLRGFGRNNPDVEALTQAERNVIYAIRTYSQFQNQFAVEITRDYFDLLAQQTVIRNRYTNYLSRVTATERLEARAKDREQIASVDQARQAQLTSRNNYVDALARYQTSLDQFKIKLSVPLGERFALDPTPLERLVAVGLIDVPLDPDRAFKSAVERQMLLLNAIDEFEDIKRKVSMFKDQLRADLRLFGDASLQSEGAEDYTQFDPKKVRAGVGLELDLPIDRLRQRNTYRASLVAFELEIRELGLTLDNLKDDIQGGLRTLNLRRQNFEIQRNALELANRRVASSTMLLEAGRAEVRDLIEAQDAQINAQNAVTAAIVSYQDVRLQLMLDIGALQTSEPDFWLKDHVAAFFGEPLPTAEARPAQTTVLPPENYLIN